VAAGSGSAPEGLLPRRESLWLGEGWTIIGLVPLPLVPSRRGRGKFIFYEFNKNGFLNPFLTLRQFAFSLTVLLSRGKISLSSVNTYSILS